MQVAGSPNGEVASEMVTRKLAANTHLDDYAITYKAGNGTITRSSEIEKALTVEFAGGSKRYDGASLTITPAVVFPDTEDVRMQYGLRDDLTGDVATWVDDPSGLNLVGAGRYTVVAKVSSPNYSGEKKVSASFEITRRPYTVTTGGAVRPYNGLPLTSDEVVVEGLAPGEAVDVRTTGSITEVGTVDNAYELAWTGTAQEANCQLAGETLGRLEVVEADYAVEVRGYVGPYDGAEHGVTVSAPADASKVAGAADPVLTGSVEGLVAGDSLGVNYVRANTSETVGIYRDVLMAQYEENPNYAITVVPGTFMILPVAPAPAAVPVPAADEPAVTPEVIEDDATPQAATPTPAERGEQIADEGTPLGAFDEPH